jgi:hypothetical protein
MKNIEILKHLYAEADHAYDGMMKQRITECAYEYHRGRYDEVFRIRKDIEQRLKDDAFHLNDAIALQVADLQRARKWTILPRNRRRIDAAMDALAALYEPTKDLRQL